MSASHTSILLSEVGINPPKTAQYGSPCGWVLDRVSTRVVVVVVVVVAHPDCLPTLVRVPQA